MMKLYNSQHCHKFTAFAVVAIPPPPNPTRLDVSTFSGFVFNLLLKFTETHIVQSSWFVTKVTRENSVKNVLVSNEYIMYQNSSFLFQMVSLYLHLKNMLFFLLDFFWHFFFNN